MTLRRADDILAWLLARQPDKRIVEKTTGLPYGWGLWLRALKPLPRPFRSTEVIAQLIDRPLPASPGRLPALGFVQALRRLAWQTWDPAPRDQRWMRWTSGVVSVLLHVLFALLLLWVALIRPPVPPAEQGGDGGRMQVEFIGRGTPQDAGGGAPAAPAETAATDAAAASAAAASAAPSGRAVPRPATSAPVATAPTPSEPTPSPPTPPQPQPQPPQPEPQPQPQPAPAPVAATPTPPTPEPAVVEPPIQATEVAEATTDFVVPPVVVPRDAAQPQVRERTVTTVEAPAVTPTVPAARPVDVQIRPREVTVREREVTTITAPTPTVAVRGPQMDVTLPQRELQVREREVAAAPEVNVTVPSMTPREIRVPGRSPEVTVRERAVPNAAPRPAPTAASTPVATDTATPSAAPAATPSTSSTATPTTGSATPSAAPRSASAAAAASASTATPAATPAARPAPNPGDWSTPARGDDWGAASRSAPGSSTQANQGTGRSGDGLFNADGSVRVPGQDGSGDSERGAPGGENDGWSRERIAQSGTWLKRPPYDYTPTSFDKYWAPNESLLAEWVRKGIKAVEIPIPGSSSKISCVVSILQFGGGCGLTDPNMQEQPAVARPPPDVPFKKELQEDNGSR